jgi:hypothetical protein
MVNQIVQNVQHQLVEHLVQRVCLIVKLLEVMYVDIPVSKMEVGKKQFIQEFIEITK